MSKDVKEMNEQEIRERVLLLGFGGDQRSLCRSANDLKPTCRRAQELRCVAVWLPTRDGRMANLRR